MFVQYYASYKYSNYMLLLVLSHNFVDLLQQTFSLSEDISLQLEQMHKLRDALFGRCGCSGFSR